MFYNDYNSIITESEPASDSQVSTETIDANTTDDEKLSQDPFVETSAAAADPFSSR